MEISRPLLPPKTGYVEVEVNGKRTYRNVATGVLIDDEVAEVSTEDILLELAADHEERLCLLELGAI